jgi:hypothetical protein
VRDSIVTTLSPAAVVIATTAGSLLGADSLGRVHASLPMPFDDLGGGMRRIRRNHVLVDRTTVRVDTVTTVRGTTLRSQESGPEGSRTTTNMELMFSVADQSLLFRDGWLAVARQEPYRVDWFPPGGAPIPGSPIAHGVVRVNDTEKEHWAARISRDFPNAAASLAVIPFTDVLAPFTAGSLVALPNGTLLVRRHPTSRAPGNDHDIIDRRGVRIATLKLAPDARVVAAGLAHLYVATRDEDGIERLSRHAWR